MAPLQRWVQTIALTVLLVSCEAGAPTLIGQWSGNHPQGGPNTFEFREDGSVTWAYAAPAVGILELTYDVDYSVVPHTFALHGFVGGPLDGMSLYGIVEFTTDDVFRLDVEPGPPHAAAPSDYRPTTFTDQTQTYQREAT